MIDMLKLESQDNRHLQLTFEDHLKAPVNFHLEKHHFLQPLLQVLEQNDFTHNEDVMDLIAKRVWTNK